MPKSSSSAADTPSRSLSTLADAAGGTPVPPADGVPGSGGSPGSTDVPPTPDAAAPPSDGTGGRTGAGGGGTAGCERGTDTRCVGCGVGVTDCRTTYAAIPPPSSTSTAILAHMMVSFRFRAAGSGCLSPRGDTTAASDDTAEGGVGCCAPCNGIGAVLRCAYDDAGAPITCGDAPAACVSP